MWHSHYASLPGTVLKFYPLMPTVPQGPRSTEGKQEHRGVEPKPTSLAVLVGQLNAGADLSSRNPLPLVYGSAWRASNVF